MSFLSKSLTISCNSRDYSVNLKLDKCEKHLLFICLFILLFSCNQSDKKITIVNKTSFVIDSICINSQDVHLVYRNILPNASITKKFIWNFKTDYEGAFIYTIYQKDTVKAGGTFGYYANDYDIKSEYTVSVHKGFKIREK